MSQLPYFFLQRHLSEQILQTHLHALCRILVRVQLAVLVQIPKSLPAFLVNPITANRNCREEKHD